MKILLNSNHPPSPLWVIEIQGTFSSIDTNFRLDDLFPLLSNFQMGYFFKRQEIEKIGMVMRRRKDKI